MRKWICTMLLLSVLLSCFAGCSQSQQPSLGAAPVEQTGIRQDSRAMRWFTETPILSRQDALACLEQTWAATGITNVTQTLGDCRESAFLDSVFYRFDQVYQGLPVYGRSVTVVANTAGYSQSLSHNYLPVADLDIQPQLNREEAARIVSEQYGGQAAVMGGELCVYSLFGCEPTLAWQLQAFGPALQDTCFVDAHSGRFLTALSQLQTETAVGECTVSGDILEFNTTVSADGGYLLMDEERNLQVYDAQNRTVQYCVVDDSGQVYRYDKDKKIYVDSSGNKILIQGDLEALGTLDVLDADGNIIGRNADLLPCAGEPLEPLQILSSSTTQWLTRDAAKVMSLVGDVYDFYQDCFGITGFNDKNGRVMICVNDDINGDPGNAYSSFGDTKAFTVLSFGHAADITEDVVGHEFNHSVEQSNSAMVYTNESGAIMEALADVFGELFEDWQADQLLDGDCDWIHGSRNLKDPGSEKYKYCYYENQGRTCPVWKKNGKHLFGDGEIKEPGLFSDGSCLVRSPYPTVYQAENYLNGAYDNGGVHINSTVISHALYRLVEPEQEGIQALTNQELADLLFHTLPGLTADCSFKEFAAQLSLSAQAMRWPSDKQECLAAAFEAAGVEGYDIMRVELSNDAMDYLVPQTSQWTVLTQKGAICDHYTLRITNKQTIQNLYQEEPAAPVESAVAQYKVDTKEPLTLDLEPGYLYEFDFTDDTDPEKTLHYLVGVYDDSMGVTRLVELESHFGSGWQPNDHGQLFLTERPYDLRAGTFISQEYGANGYVVKEEGKSTYILTAPYPAIDTIVTFWGDFAHNGGSKTLSLVHEGGGDRQSSYLWIQLDQPRLTESWGSEILDLRYDSENYYYLVDGKDAAYIVSERVEYSNVRVEDNKYYYKTDLDKDRRVKESIMFMNLDTMDRTTYSLVYGEDLSWFRYTELKVAWEDSTADTQELYDSQGDNGRFQSAQEAEEYIRQQLQQLGLSDRVLSQSSQLSGHTPVAILQVEGEPGVVNTDHLDGQALHAVLTIGRPAYTGQWQRDGVPKDTTLEPEEEPESTSKSTGYQDFLSSKGYQADWQSLDPQGAYPPGAYALLDIDADGAQELIIVSNTESEYGGTFNALMVYTLCSGQVVRLPVCRSDRDEELFTCYGVPTYSREHHALVFSELKPNAMNGAMGYFVVGQSSLDYIGYVGVQTDMAQAIQTYTSTVDGSRVQLTDQEYSEIMNTLQWLSFTPLP